MEFLATELPVQKFRRNKELSYQSGSYRTVVANDFKSGTQISIKISQFSTKYQLSILNRSLINKKNSKSRKFTGRIPNFEKVFTTFPDCLLNYIDLFLKYQQAGNYV